MFKKLKAELLRLQPEVAGLKVIRYAIRRRILTETPDERSYYVIMRLVDNRGNRFWNFFMDLPEAMDWVKSKGGQL